tara:strand:+ start:70 stop:1491 length:1422 start_codon:yes stop_codon:yes gene_type:complete
MFFSQSKKLLLFSTIGYLFIIYFFNQKFHTSLVVFKENINLYFIYLIFLLNIAPIIFYFYSKDEKSNLPIFYLSLIYFFFSYTLFFISNSWNVFDEHRLSEHQNAIEIFLIGIFFYNLGYYLFFSLIKKSKKSLKIFEIDNNKELLLLGLLTLTGVIVCYNIIDLPKYINGIQQLKYPLLYLSYGFLVLYIFNTQKTISLYFKILLFLLILIPIVFDMLAGAFFTPFISVFLNIIFFMYLGQKITKFNLISIVSTILILFFIIQIKTPYRNAIWTTENNSTVDKFLIYKSELYSLLKKFNFQQPYKINTVSRIFHSYESLVIVVNKTPSDVDYFEGKSYKILTSKIIPRIFWKNKPSDVLGNTYGRRYNIILETDNYTSWNMPVLNEFYVNYGLKGVILGMFLLGFFFRFISTFFSIKNNYNTEKIVAFYIFVPLFFLESHLSLMFGALLQSYVFLLIFFVIYKKVFRLLKII